LGVKKDNLQNKLPKGVAKECFLFEAVNYLICGCAPIDSTDHSFDSYDQDIRNCSCLYYRDSAGFSACQNQELMNEIVKEKYGIQNPYFEQKYFDVNFQSSIEEFDRWNKDSLNYWTNDAKALKQKTLEYKQERKLIVEYLKQQNFYDKKLREIEEPFKNCIGRSIKKRDDR
jgi:hypothetical protein